MAWRANNGNNRASSAPTNNGAVTPTKNARAGKPTMHAIAQVLENYNHRLCF